jgi:2-methoxy-6-polyprenyl-1,4-benzoquinol methylase
MVGGVFSNVADSYDVMNDAMSLGVHRVWKNYFVDQIGPIRARRTLLQDGKFEYHPMGVLDVAGGTGDISFKILEKSRRDNPYKDLQVDITVSDINADMLEVGKKRAIE